MITRVWRGWSDRNNADAYQALLQRQIFPGIERRKIPGHRGISLSRRDCEDTVEFLTIMWFDSIDAIKAFAGDDYAKAVVPPEAQALLSRFDPRCVHYDTVRGAPDVATRTFGGTSP